MSNLEPLKEESLKIFDGLRKTNRKKRINFSGGKDSHALLALYFLWMESRQEKLNIDVVFSDTGLESSALLDIVNMIEKHCEKKGVTFKIVKRTPTKSFWYILFGLGYPVPDHINRWCTKELKVKLLTHEKNLIQLTGVHYGESKKRDNRLDKGSQGCGSTECGIDLIPGTVEPIKNWRNCNVWDFLLEASYYGWLPENHYQKLADLYAVDSDENGSSRMGCFMCPVVKKENIERQAEAGLIPEFSISVREILEVLRNSKRIMSKKPGVLGAILLEERIKVWQMLQMFIPDLLKEGWISHEEIELINKALEVRQYPPSYNQEHIDRYEPFAVNFTDYRIIKKAGRLSLLG